MIVLNLLKILFNIMILLGEKIISEVFLFDINMVSTDKCTLSS